MNRRIAFIFPFFCALLLSGCGSGRSLFLFEQPYWSIMGGGPVLQARFDARSLARGSVPTLLVIQPGDDPHVALQSALATGRYATVILGPLLSLEATSIAENNPRVRFILAHAPLTVTAPNVTVLWFDRRDAFRAAGAAAALTAAAESKAASDEPPHIGVLTSALSDLATEEVNAFIEGVAAEMGGREPAMRTVTSDPASIKAAIASMRRDGVRVFLLALGVGNPAALDALRSAGGSAVAADWAESRLYPAQVLLSVETDEAGGILRAVRAAGSGTPRVSGHVRIELGGAGQVSSAALARIAAHR